MTGRSSPSPAAHPAKRARQSARDRDSPPSLVSAGAATSPIGETGLPDSSGPDAGDQGSGARAAKGGQSSNFRNVSACNRCRLRKNRCDQRLPSCASCEKANVSCVGYDPITKREIPRSYVFYLETRVEQLEALLLENDISFPPADNLEYCSRAALNAVVMGPPTDAGHPVYSGTSEGGPAAQRGGMEDRTGEDMHSKPRRRASKIGVSRPGVSANPRYLGSATGVSFARVVFAAVQSSVTDQRTVPERDRIRPYKPVARNPGTTALASPTSMRDSFFGLHTKPTISPATFPSRELGSRLVNLYFEHANPQIPVLHRVDFMRLFDKAYAGDEKDLGPKELYMLNMVFAIGGGIVMGDQPRRDSRQGDGDRSKQCHPEEYHASAIVHLEACLSNSSGGLEELQAVLLLANFALLRPVPPGLWYIIGVAVRLAVDLGLHYEDGKDVAAGLHPDSASSQREGLAKERGRREYIRDLRRRLWWCTYALDRLVSVCVGRPLGVSDQVITTEFPSLLEDRYITPAGFVEPSQPAGEPTYKLVAHHYFRLRLLQSEILQVLQYQQAQSARATGQNQRREPHMHAHLPCPFLSRFDSFRSWRIDIDRRLYEWKTSAPTKQENGVEFTTDFLDLNYWQAIIMLYRQSVSVPAMFEGEYHTSKEVDTPTVYEAELHEDEDRVYVQVAEAGQRTLRLYRSLHLVGLVSYTYLATHHLFMAGISYLYAIWHSPVVRSRLTMDEVDFTILAATSVFTDLIDKCPPAEACRDAFDRTARATIKMANATGGFGQGLSRQSGPRSGGLDHRTGWPASPSSRSQRHRHQRQPSSAEHLGQRDVSSFDVGEAASSGYRVPDVKHERDGGSHAALRHVPARPQSIAGSSDDTGSGEPAIDPALLPSPHHHHRPASPVAATTPQTNASAGVTSSAANVNDPFLSSQQQQQETAPVGFSPGSAMNLADFQDMDFLQGLGMTPAGGGGGGDNQVEFGLGIGWGGHHDDFSDGQQVDLFDGFFSGAGGGGEPGDGRGGM